MSPQFSSPRRLALATLLAGLGASALAAAPLTDKELLGQSLFNDKNLSEPRGQSCASCHDAARAFSDSGKGPTSEGVIKGLFGPRNAPSILYASMTPPLQQGGDDGPLAYIGGQFRDGRANFVEDQAKLPLLNPTEMANPSPQAVVNKVKAAKYAAKFLAIYGSDIFNDPGRAYDAIGDAIGAFERSKIFAPFSSKFDAYQQGKATLSAAEEHGLAVFNDPAKANCASCHSPVSARPDGRKSLFTDFGYDNIGVPRNPGNRFYSMPAEFNPDGKNFVDVGLGAVVSLPATQGQFKAPSLRNVAITGPYMHNGYFKTLRGLVDFDNTRDVRPACLNRFTSEAKAQRLGCWPVGEVTETVNKVDMGNLGLNDQEVDDLVTYLGTLTDGWQPPQLPPQHPR